ncbi:hypothetical protein, partial [Bacteroides uniformis]|uniref:hypothetical protein n=1 Tax=Bacteroides uniformis TaxID=820 RepID=UPI001AA1A179
NTPRLVHNRNTPLRTKAGVRRNIQHKPVVRIAARNTSSTGGTRAWRVGVIVLLRLESPELHH